ncbi:hypothetical protein K502DRAFT_193574 [Neoconidiobolus thromboides FSU 785]|nr:hypothetical protein K502DRAFT_193574 [Neoconidiobolus thromboides FSU 785]
MAYDFFFEASIEFSTILATFSTECITQCTLLEEDIISKKEYYDDSMYGLNQNLQLAFVTNKQFASRCLKKLLICLEMLASKNPTNFKYTEWMLILIQFGWPYWEFAFDNVIVKRLEEYPVEEFPILLKYIYVLFVLYLCFILLF